MNSCVCLRCGSIAQIFTFGCSVCFDAQETAETLPDGSTKHIFHTKDGDIVRTSPSPVQTPHPLSSGDFVRVREDSQSVNRAGKDGMVTNVVSPTEVGLIFGYDRYNQPQDCACVGTELWETVELDLQSIYR